MVGWLVRRFTGPVVPFSEQGRTVALLSRGRTGTCSRRYRPSCSARNCLPGCSARSGLPRGPAGSWKVRSVVASEKANSRSRRPAAGDWVDPLSSCRATAPCPPTLLDSASHRFLSRRRPQRYLPCCSPRYCPVAPSVLVVILGEIVRVWLLAFVLSWARAALDPAGTLPRTTPPGPPEGGVAWGL